MKLVRPLLISLAALLVVALIAVAVAFNSSFQTWAVRRMLAARPGVHTTIGRVSAGLHRIELANVSWEQNGTTFVAPAVAADLSLPTAVWSRRIMVSRLVAHGWTLRLASAPVAVTSTPPPSSRKPAAASSASGEAPALKQPTVAANPFAGVLTPVRLPLDFSVRELDLGGVVMLPADAGRAQVKITGGGLGAGSEATFDLTAAVTLPDDPVNAVNLHGQVRVGMDTPRTFTKFEGRFDATAAGPQLNRPVTLNAALAVARNGQKESYTAALTAADRTLVAVRAEYPAAGGRISGSWNVDVRDSDVAPFSLGRLLPQFSATGQGLVDTDPAFANVHAVGSLEAQVDRLTVLDRSLAAVGAVRVKADIDLARRGDVLTVAKTDIAIARSGGNSTSETVADVHSLQPFDFSPASGELRADDASRELVGIALRGVPLAWLRPFLSDVELTGGDIHGELVATPRAGGFSFKTKVPLSVAGLTGAKAGKPFVRNVDVALGAAGDYTPVGWQAEISGLTVRSGTTSVLLLDAKAGRLAGANQPIKATGLLTVDLKSLAAQPWSPRPLALARGDASVEFVATVGAQTEVQANIAVRNLVPVGAAPGRPLPSITAQLRADIADNGKITLSAPIALERDGRVSDVTVSGTLVTLPGGMSFDAKLTSGNFVIDDAKVLGVLTTDPAKAPTQRGPGAGTPAWAGLNGTLALQLKKLVYTGDFEMSNVTGTLHFAGGALKLDHVQAGVGEAGGATVTGTLSYDRAAVAPFNLAADIALTDFDPTPLFVAVNPRQPPTIEGKFTIATRVTARAVSMDELPGAVIGDFNLTSRGGTFRGLEVNVGNLVENSSKLVSWLASAGNAITSLAGRKEDLDEITSRSQAANELAKILSSITYDQLALVVTRDDLFNAEVREMTLISPELRITGSGRAHGAPGAPLLRDSVDLELQLRARGRPAELMKYLGVLDPKVDDLGYAACTIPVQVQGNLARLDTTQLSNRLVALAVAKTGLTEKAVDWINRLRGKGPN